MPRPRGRKPGFTVSEETREKQRLAHLGKPYNLSPEGRAVLVTNGIRTSENRTPESIERQRQKMLGRKHSAETKAKMSEAHKKLGPKSEITKERMSAAKMGHSVSEEARVKMRARKLGMKHSDETKAKMRAARLAWMQKRAETGHDSITGFSKIRGYYYSTKMMRNIPYRSSYEKRYIELLDNDPEVEKFDYEPFHIRYKYNRRWHAYLPDFLVKKTSGFVLVEIKPLVFTDYPVNRAKFKAATLYCKEKGWFFEIVTEEGLAPRQSATKPAEWDSQVGRKAQRLTAEESQPIKQTRAPANSVRVEEIVRHSEEIRRDKDKEPC